MATYLFRTPVRVVDGPRVVTLPNRKTDYDDGTLAGNVLMRHYKRPGQAVCVIIDQDGTVREKQVPIQTELVAALRHYLGGHDYMVSEAEAVILEAAGYDVIGYGVGFGVGGFGYGPYGDPTTDRDQYGMGAYGMGPYGI